MLLVLRGRERKKFWVERRETKFLVLEVGELWCSVWRLLFSGLSKCSLVSWNLGLGSFCRGYRLFW